MIISFTAKVVSFKGLLISILVTTRPEVWLGNFRVLISSLLRILTVIFKLSISEFCFSTGSFFSLNLKSSDVSNLPKRTI